jgi:hypothetical protein
MMESIQEEQSGLEAVKQKVFAELERLLKAHPESAELLKLEQEVSNLESALESRKSEASEIEGRIPLLRHQILEAIRDGGDEKKAFEKMLKEESAFEKVQASVALLEEALPQANQQLKAAQETLRDAFRADLRSFHSEYELAAEEAFAEAMDLAEGWDQAIRHFFSQHRIWPLSSFAPESRLAKRNKRLARWILHF